VKEAKLLSFELVCDRWLWR